MTLSSDREAGEGVLYVVATPIGNLEDVTLRALRVLAEVALIAAEDTRRTRKLLARFEIGTPMISCFREKELLRVDRVLELLAGGKDVALVSDAGTPAISDPGALLVARVRAQGYRVIPVPGASAVTAALSVAGMPAGPFLFLGFLPARSGQRRKALQERAACRNLLVFYEAPHRIVGCLEDCLAIFGDREIFLARELTKVHEELFHGRLAEARDRFAARGEGVKGEFVVVLAGGEAAEPPAADQLAELLRWYRDHTGESLKDAVRQVSQHLNVARSEVYRLALEVWQGRN